MFGPREPARVEVEKKSVHAVGIKRILLIASGSTANAQSEPAEEVSPVDDYEMPAILRKQRRMWQ